MTRKDYILIAECIAECYKRGYDLDDTIGYFRYRLHGHGANRFNPSKFKKYIYEKVVPDYIPEEQKGLWVSKRTEKS